MTFADFDLTAEKLHHVRLNRFVDMDPQALEAAIPPVRDELAPMLGALSGCRSVLVGVDLRRGTGTVITFWTSEDDMRAGSRVETVARERAVALAGATIGKGLVDTYGLVVERATWEEEPQFARLARWEGVSPARMGDALLEFEERDVPVLDEIPGFAGLFTATNKLLGNTLSVTLWNSKEALRDSRSWELDVRTRIESKAGLTPRRVIADTYEVVTVPELRELYSRSGRAYEFVGA